MAPLLLRDDEGAQIIEYALIIAVISLGLIVAMAALPTGVAQAVVDLAGRISDCLSGSGCT